MIGDRKRICYCAICSTYCQERLNEFNCDRKLWSDDYDDDAWKSFMHGPDGEGGEPWTSETANDFFS